MKYSKSNIRIATMTLDSKGDRELMERTLYSISRQGYKAHVFDGGSSRKFLKNIRKMSHVVESETRGLGYQMKNAILSAATCDGCSIVLYTEPDKLEWVEEKMAESIDEYLRNDLDFAAVARTKKQFDSYPADRRDYEKIFNDFVVFPHTRGRISDATFGPKFMKDHLARELGNVRENLVWGTIQYPLGRAVKLGLKVGEIHEATECPEREKDEHDPEYRMLQTFQNNKGFMIGLVE